MHILVRGSTIFLLIGDLVTFTSSLILTLLVRYQEIPSQEIVNQHLGPFFYLFFLWVVVYLIAGLYDQHVTLVRKRIPTLVFRVQLVNILLSALFFFTFPFGIEPKTNLVIYLLISTALILFWRLYIFPLITTGKPMKALVVGSSPEAMGIARVLASNPYFKNIKPFQIGREHMEFEEFRESLLTFVAEENPKMIVADMRDDYAQRLTRDFYMLAFEDQSISFFNLPGIYEQLHHRVPPSIIEETWFLENITTKSPHYAYDFLKRSIDFVGACVLLFPALILFPFIMFAIKFHDNGPIFYRSVRVGQFNNPITILKFRTMTGMDDGITTTNSTLVVTKVGAFLRKTRLDELPQLLNIIVGDLSFIGPRPETPARAAIYAGAIPYYNMRHHIKPGLSGWAQINNFEVPRGEVDVTATIEKLSFDLYYLKNRSFFLDFEIILKTLNTLILRSGT